MEQEDRPTTINMLLDVEKFSGEYEGRMGPVIWFLLLSGAPLIVYINYLLGVLPFLVFLPFYLFFVARVAMIILGEEKKRVDQFKRQLYDVYSSTLDLMNIKTIHDDGCVEYVNGMVSYMVVAINGNFMDLITRAQIVRKFLLQINQDFTADIYCQNVVSDDELANRYSGVKLFNDAEVAKDFIDIIDNNRKIVSNQSLISQAIFTVQGRRNEFKTMRRSIETAMASDDAKIFKGLKLADKAEVEEIISRDIDAYINFEEVQRQKYSTGTYYDSKVVGYDVNQIAKDKVITEERGFLVSE